MVTAKTNQFCSLYEQVVWGPKNGYLLFECALFVWVSSRRYNLMIIFRHSNNKREKSKVETIDLLDFGKVYFKYMKCNGKIQSFHYRWTPFALGLVNYWDSVVDSVLLLFFDIYILSLGSRKSKYTREKNAERNQKMGNKKGGDEVHRKMTPEWHIPYDGAREMIQTHT